MVVNSTITNEGEEVTTQMAVITERSQGGTSIKNGTIELMQQRRFITDDEKGIGYDYLNEYIDNTFLNEGIKVKATYFLKLSQFKTNSTSWAIDNTSAFRLLQLRQMDNPQLFIN